MNRILLIEDQEELRELVEYNLVRDGQFQVESVDNANDALMMLEDIEVDLILLDLMLPGLSGLEFLRILKNSVERSEIPVIIISAKSGEQDIVTGLSLGADDYITKPFSMKVLKAKVDAVLRRALHHDNRTVAYGSISIDMETHKAYVDGNEVVLTMKEFELLHLFLKRPKKVFHRNQLLSSIWGYDSEVYTRTVDAHISSLRKKLGDKGKMIRSIPKVGYGMDL
ncbi:response regulator [Desulfurispirillum indicum]|uniref:Response regulator receiver n=1 Tax=Desulfurispirillum indicum (strain ATCC BAA-1389 / DSM 22839 / S5) TaxID=653733 RepID=E6W6G0_DESIS|nr:response regulator [Desulfurispirillum indicum]ADU67295.1 response regulator receiver [Desulfurispirillum indicum S5]UCZ56667.1 response regulator [Desulfurispirillum indicum]